MKVHPESIDIVSFEKTIQILIHTPFQMKTLENLEDGATFGIDSTHCTTRYGFYLTTIHLIQKTGGTPVVHMISSDEKEQSIDVLTQFIGSKIKCNNISLISDDYPAYVNSWFRNVGESNHIQCLWHLKKNWKKNLNSNGLTGQKNISVLSLLNHLSMSRSETEFSSGLKELKKISNDEFMRYFERYIKLKEKWVFCFKKGNKYDSTNMHIESWHRVLKYSYLQSKKNKRVDKLIVTLMAMSNDLDYRAKVKSLKGQRGTFNSKNSMRHNVALSKNFVINGTSVQVI